MKKQHVALALVIVLAHACVSGAVVAHADEPASAEELTANVEAVQGGVGAANEEGSAEASGGSHEAEELAVGGDADGATTASSAAADEDAEGVGGTAGPVGVDSGEALGNQVESESGFVTGEADGPTGDEAVEANDGSDVGDAAASDAGSDAGDADAPDDEPAAGTNTEGVPTSEAGEKSTSVPNSTSALEPSAEPSETSSAAALANENDSFQNGAQEASESSYAAAHQNMYRLYNPNSGEHFYTASLDEATSVVEAGWRYEGVGWVAPKSSPTPVFRLYNPNAGDHHYTTSEAERDNLIAEGWRYEGIGWYSDEEEGSLSVLRQYNPNAEAGAHNFTLSSEEHANLVSLGWSGEGEAWRATNGDTLAIEGRWIVTSAWGTLERYWLASDASIATNRLVTPEEGAGYYAYATDTGAVVRGKYAGVEGYVYLADAEGRLASTADGQTGWLVTGSYDDGNLQRYYLDMTVHAARTGFVSVEGVGGFWGIASEGYVSRGKYALDAYVLLSDNDGVLAVVDGEGAWLVTGIYDGGSLQRYYLELVAQGVAGLYGARTGLFEVDGSQYWGLVDVGYVERNVYAWRDEHYYSSDNEGVLTEIEDDYTRTVNAIVAWMLNMAQDDSHGYDQAYRWGEYGDYDCSSLVITALKEAGLDTYGATYTGDMLNLTTGGHFVWITDLSKRQRGDILLNITYHTAIYIGDEQLCHASGNEWGGATGGVPGDQTGKEICVRSYFERPWDGLLRYVA